MLKNISYKKSCIGCINMKLLHVLVLMTGIYMLDTSEKGGIFSIFVVKILLEFLFSLFIWLLTFFFLFIYCFYIYYLLLVVLVVVFGCCLSSFGLVLFCCRGFLWNFCSHCFGCCVAVLYHAIRAFVDWFCFALFCGGFLFLYWKCRLFEESPFIVDALL